MDRKTYFGLLVSSVLITIMPVAHISNRNIHTWRSTTVIAISPPTSEVCVNHSFDLNLTISNVSDLYLWVVTLEWNPAILDFVEYEEGPFLKEGGNTSIIDGGISPGKIRELTCTLLGEAPAVNGSGTMVTLMFNATNIGTPRINITFSDLLNSKGESIAHDTIDGVIKVKVHDVAIVNITISKTVAIPEETIYINVTVENRGDYTESFDVSVCYTIIVDPLIGTQTATLEVGANITLSFTWTTPNTLGQFRIGVEVPLPEDTHPTDNSCTTIMCVIEVR